MLQPAASAILPASILVIMPPEPSPETGLPAIASISGVISLTSGMTVAPGVPGGALRELLGLRDRP